MSESDDMIKSLELSIPKQIINKRATPAQYYILLISLDKMNSRRVDTIQNIIVLLYDRCEKLYIDDRDCDFDCSSIMYGILTSRMRSIGLALQGSSALYSSLTHKGLVEAIRSFTSSKFYSPNNRFNRCRVCTYSFFKFIIEGVEADIEGLDLAAFDL